MTCYLALSRRLELVVPGPPAFRHGSSSRRRWPSAILLGFVATTAYNPISANLRELSKRMEAELFGSAPGGRNPGRLGFLDQSDQQRWPGHHQRGAQRAAGRALDWTDAVQVRQRLSVQGANEAREATLEEGRWVFKSVSPLLPLRARWTRIISISRTSLTPAQVRNSFSTPRLCLLATANVYPVLGKLGFATQATGCNTTS